MTMTDERPVQINGRAYPVEKYGFFIYSEDLAADPPHWTAIYHQLARSAGYLTLTEPTIEGPLQDWIAPGFRKWVVTGRAIDLTPDAFGEPDPSGPYDWPEEFVTFLREAYNDPDHPIHVNHPEE